MKKTHSAQQPLAIGIDVGSSGVHAITTNHSGKQVSLDSATTMQIG